MRNGARTLRGRTGEARRRISLSVAAATSLAVLATCVVSTGAGAQVQRTTTVTQATVTQTAARVGYWMLGRDGTVYGFGDAQGSTGAMAGAASIATRSDGLGYWVVDVAGSVRAQGTARVLGGVPTLATGEMVTTMSATPSGDGYWLFTSRGRVLPYGDARDYGDMSRTRLNGPVIASVATPTGHGYYMVGSDGGVFSFGDARFHGSTGGLRLNSPIAGISPTPDNKGYWLVASDGGVFAFRAPFRGSMGGTRLYRPVTGLVAFGNGYLMAATDGGIFNFSNKPFLGSLSGRSLTAPVTAIAAFSTSAGKSVRVQPKPNTPSSSTSTPTSAPGTTTTLAPTTTTTVAPTTTSTTAKVTTTTTTSTTTTTTTTTTLPATTTTTTTSTTTTTTTTTVVTSTTTTSTTTTTAPTTTTTTTVAPTTTTTTTAPGGAGVNKARPFSATSPWNTPTASGTQWYDTPSLHQLSDGSFRHWWANTDSVGVWWSSPTDPVWTFNMPDYVAPSFHRNRPAATFTMRAPADLAAGTDVDHILVVVDPVSGDYTEVWQASVDPSTHTVTNLPGSPGWARGNAITGPGAGTLSNNDGVRAANFSWLAGLITGADVDAGVIDHALVVALPSAVLMGGGNTGHQGGVSTSTPLAWRAPATAWDAGFWSGPIQMGSRLGIPAGTPMPSGLSTLGVMVFDALQKYGAFVGDYAGGEWPNFYVDNRSLSLGAPNTGVLRPLFCYWEHNGSSDMEKIAPLMRVADYQP
jgi:hypothetical protein